MPMILNPVEKNALAECEQPLMLGELDQLLAPHDKELVRSAIVFLHRVRLVDQLGSGHYVRTELGDRVLGLQTRRELGLDALDNVIPFVAHDAA
jgi:hypothetical protein